MRVFFDASSSGAFDPFYHYSLPQANINNMSPQKVNVFGSDVEDVHFINGTLRTVYGLKLYDPKLDLSMVSHISTPIIL